MLVVFWMKLSRLEALFSRLWLDAFVQTFLAQHELLILSRPLPQKFVYGDPSHYPFVLQRVLILQRS